MLRPPLSFSFTGFTVWLLPKQSPTNDLTKLAKSFAKLTNTEPLPCRPHITLFYGVQLNGGEEQAKEMFLELKESVKSFPGFCVNGLVCDTEFAGVNGGLMEMAWSELSLKLQDEHLPFVDRCKDVFRGGKTNKEDNWIPHLSLGYDNPMEGCLYDMSALTRAIGEVNGDGEDIYRKREIEGLALVDTNGRIDEWRILDEFLFQDDDNI